jgi:5'(3')-deoxyribonucleotidase
MRIGLDFDRVLFDTDSFDDFYKEKVEGLHHVEDPAPVKNGCYDPEMHAELCGIPEERIWKVFEHNLSQFLYSDIELLKDLQKRHELLIVSRGHERFQRSKIEASGADRYVEKVHIVQDKSKDSVEIDLLVDDRKEELERAEVPEILLKRPEEGLKKVLEEVDDLEA